MKGYLNYIAAALIVISILAGASTASEPYVQDSRMVVQEPMPVNMQELNFTKLEINPRYGNFRLQPGESRDMTVTITNKEKKTVTVKPNVATQPYGEYILEKEWIEITPGSAEIPAGGSQKFTVKASIPKDASTGYYNGQVAFTDEEIPSPYPQPYPSYVHAFQLSIDVWTPPNVQISKSFINEQLEAGKEYNFTIKLKNVADKTIPINPRLSKDNYMSYGPYGTTEQAFKDEAVTIIAPREIAAGQTAEVKVIVIVPANAKGNYHGVMELGIEDSSFKDPWTNMVNMDFGVWNQPVEPFVKTFTTDEAVPVTIEVSSNLLNGIFSYMGYPGGTVKNDKTPSFEVDLNGPDNEPISMKKTKSVIKGGVSLGGMGTVYPPWESESEGIYKEMGTQYTETYTANVPAGENKLSILPHDTQGFEYTITIGG